MTTYTSKAAWRYGTATDGGAVSTGLGRLLLPAGGGAAVPIAVAAEAHGDGLVGRRTPCGRIARRGGRRLARRRR